MSFAAISDMKIFARDERPGNMPSPEKRVRWQSLAKVTPPPNAEIPRRNPAAAPSADGLGSGYSRIKVSSFGVAKSVLRAKSACAGPATATLLAVVDLRKIALACRPSA
jgi:hypothetical protein